MSKYGLTYRGKHSYNDFGLIMLSKDRPILPDMKEITEDRPGGDGEFDYSAISPDNEVKYKPRIQEIIFAFDRSRIDWRDPRVIRLKARQIAAWLCGGEAELIFDDESDKVEIAKVANKLSLENQIETGRPFMVNFKCRPFPSLRQNADEIILDSYVLLESDIRLDESYQFTVTAPVTVEVNNFGTHAVKPLIRMSGSFTTLSLSAGGKTLIYSEAVSNKTIDINCELMQAKEGSVNKTYATSGYFTALQPGINSISITGTGLNCTVQFIFKPLYY